MPGAAKIIGRIAVKVIPDTSRFREDAKRELEKVAKELEVEVNLVPKMDGFKQKAKSELASAGRDLEVEATVKPDTNRFREEAKAGLADAGLDAKVDLDPDLRDFRREAQRELDAEKLDAKANVKVERNESRKAMQNMLNDIKSDLKTDKNHINPHIRIKDSETVAEARRVKKNLEKELEDLRSGLKIGDKDRKKFERLTSQIKDLNDELDRLESDDVIIDIQGEDAVDRHIAKIDKLRQHIKELEREKVEIGVEVDDDAMRRIAEVEDEIAKMQGTIDTANRPKVELDLDGRKALRDAVAMRREIQSEIRNLEVKVKWNESELKRPARLAEEIARVRRELDRLTSAEHMLSLSTDDFAKNFEDIHRLDEQLDHLEEQRRNITVDIDVANRDLARLAELRRDLERLNTVIHGRAHDRTVLSQVTQDAGEANDAIAELAQTIDHMRDNATRWRGESDMFDQFRASLRRARLEIGETETETTRAGNRFHWLAGHGERAASRIGRVFGQGARNNFLNLFGTAVGGLLRIIPGAINMIGNFADAGQHMMEVFRTARETMGLFPAIMQSMSAGFGSLTGSIGPVVAGFTAIAIVGPPLVAGLVTLIGTITALVASITIGLIGALLAVTPLFGALAAGVGVMAVAFMDKKWLESMKDSLSDLKKAALDATAGFKTAFRDLVRDVTPGLSSFIKKMGKSLGDVVSDFHKKLDTGRGNREAFSKWGESMPRIFEHLGKAANAFINGFMKMFVPILPYAEKLSEKIQELADRFSDWAGSTHGRNQIAEFMKRAWDDASKLWNILKNLTKTLSGLFNAADKGGGNGLLGDLEDFTKRMSDWVNDPKNAPKIKEFFKDAKEAGEKLGKVLLDIADAIGEMNTDENRDKFNGFLGDVQALTSALKDLAAILNAVGDFFSFSPGGGNGILGGGDIFSKDFWKKSWENLQRDLKTLFITLPGKISGWVASPFEWVFKKIGEQDWSGVWDNLKHSFGEIGDLFSKPFTGAWDWIDKNIIGTFRDADYSGMWQSIKDAFGEIGSLFAAPFTGAWDWIDKNILGTFRDADYSGMWDSIKTAFSEVGSVLSAPFTGAYDWVKNNIVDPVVNFDYSSIPSAIGDFFSGIDWGSIGTDILDGIKMGLTGALQAFNLDAIWETLKDIVVNAFKAVFGIHSPSTVMAEQARWIVEGVKQGITDSLNILLDVATWIKDAILSGFASAGTWLWQKGADILNGLSTAWSDLSGWVGEKWNGAKSWVTSKFEGAGTWLSQKGTDIKNGLVGAWNGLSTSVSNAWSGAKGWVTSKFSDAGSWLSDKGRMIRSGLLTAWNGLSTSVGNAWSGAKGWVRGKFSDAGSWLSDKGRAVKSGLLTAWNGLSTSVGNAWSGAKSWVRGKFSDAGSWLSDKGRAVKSSLLTAWNGLSTSVGNAWSGAKSWVRGKFSDAGSWLSDKGRSIKSSLMNAWNGLSTTVGNAWSGAKGWITSKFSNAGSWLSGAGRSIIGGLIGGLNGAKGWLSSTLGSITAMIPAKKGPPEKDRVLLTPAGRLIMQGFIRGIEREVPTLMKTLTDITRSVPAGVKGRAIGQDLTASMATGMKSRVSMVTSVVRSINRELESIDTSDRTVKVSTASAIASAKARRELAEASAPQASEAAPASYGIVQGELELRGGKAWFRGQLQENSRDVHSAMESGKRAKRA